MAVTIETTAILKDYFDGVLERAADHAKEVEEVALSLMGGVIWKSSDEIEVREGSEGLANVLWFRTNGKRYVFSYNHGTRKIEMRDRTQRGKVLHEFDNTTPNSVVLGIFRNL